MQDFCSVYHVPATPILLTMMKRKIQVPWCRKLFEKFVKTGNGVSNAPAATNA